MRYRQIIISAFIILVSTQSLSTADIIWKLYGNSSTQAGPIIEKSIAEGTPFIIREAEATGVPAGSAEVISALEGLEFLFESAPVSGPLTIHIILNISDGEFEKIRDIPLFLNISFESYRNGVKEDFIQLSQNSPLTLSIPNSSGLAYLLGMCNLTWNDTIICVYNSSGNFSNEGITSSKQSSKLMVTMDKLSGFVGGQSDELGFSSGVKVDTWEKIKLLFQ